MRYGIYPNEWYPVLELTDPDSDAIGPDEIIELTDVEVANVRRVFEEFQSVQDMLKSRLPASTSAATGRFPRRG